jgi:hypothetical protein
MGHAIPVRLFDQLLSLRYYCRIRGIYSVHPHLDDGVRAETRLHSNRQNGKQVAIAISVSSRVNASRLREETALFDTDGRPQRIKADASGLDHDAVHSASSTAWSCVWASL